MSKLSELCNEVTSHTVCDPMWKDILKIARAAKVMEEAMKFVVAGKIKNYRALAMKKALSEVERILSE